MEEYQSRVAVGKQKWVVVLLPIIYPCPKISRHLFFSPIKNVVVLLCVLLLQTVQLTLLKFRHAQLSLFLFLPFNLFTLYFLAKFLLFLILYLRLLLSRLFCEIFLQLPSKIIQYFLVNVFNALLFIFLLFAKLSQ